ncbi:MAG: DUF4350 domain-containing protein [Sporichthyaceae bacterium]
MSERGRSEEPARSTTLTTTAPAPASRVRRMLRSPLLLVGLLVAVTAGLGVLASEGNQNRLDPDSYSPQGAHALGQLLRDSGIEVVVTRDLTTTRRTLVARPDASLLITAPDLLPPDFVAELAETAAATLLVEGAGESVVAATGNSVQPAKPARTKTRDPGCDVRAATNAGRADLGGVAYERVAGDPVFCYDASLARVGTTTLVGNGAPLTNDKLDRHGNAALALGLLGERPTLVWYLPSLGDPALELDDIRRPLSSLISDAWKLAALQLGIGLVVVALWRGRRLGPLVVEPLPVVVRAAESTEGLARLYRRSNARHRAAAELRAAAVRRIAPAFGMSATHPDPRAVTEAVAAHTDRSTAEIGQLLFGAAPDSDAGLLALAEVLDNLENQVRRDDWRKPRG